MSDDYQTTQCVCDTQCDKQIRIFPTENPNIIEICVSDKEGIFPVNSGILIHKTKLIELMEQL